MLILEIAAPLGGLGAGLSGFGRRDPAAAACCSAGTARCARIGLVEGTGYSSGAPRPVHIVASVRPETSDVLVTGLVLSHW